MSSTSREKVINLPYLFDPAERPYQVEILLHPARFKVLKIHRKAGKTKLSINKLILEAANPQNPNRVYWYIAPTYGQAKEIVWRDPEMFQKHLPPELLDRSKGRDGKNETELSYYLHNGSVITIKGADKPDSLRGPNPAGVVLDENPLMKPAVWDEIIAPIAFSNPDMWVWIVGTPKPTGAHFERKYNEALEKMANGDPSWFAMKLTAEESNIIPAELLAEARKNMTDAGYRQEYLCEYLGEGGVVFRGIDSIIYGAYIEPRQLLEPNLYQWGLDLAKHVDWTVLNGINRKNHRLEVFDRYNQIDWNLQKARMEAVVRRHGGGRINMDATGVGDPILDDLRLAGLNVDGLKFTEETKRALVTNLAIGIEQRKLMIPMIPQLIDELRTFGYEVTANHRVRYNAPEGFHDDCVWALAMAWWDIGSNIKVANPVTNLISRTDIAPRGNVGGENE